MSTRIQLDQLQQSGASVGQGIVWNGSKWGSGTVSSFSVPVSASNAKGLLANIPTATSSNEGFLYEAIDSLKRAIYRSDGSSWKKLPNAFLDDLAINIKSYGAIGDGLSHPLSASYASLGAAQAVYPHATSLTNELDWAAIVSAIAAAPSGGMVYFPPTIGSYLLNMPITITKPLTWYGDGMDGVKIKNTTYSVSNLITIKAFPFQCFGITFDANNIIYHTFDLGRYDLGYACRGATIERCRFINNKTRQALSCGFYGMSGDSGYGNLRIRYCEFKDSDSTGAIQITTGTGILPYPIGNGKGAANFDISYNILDNIGGGCIIMSNMDVTGSRDGSFIKTNITNNYIKPNFTGTYGAVPVELVGHDYVTAANNILDGGTRGIGVGARYSQYNNNIFYNQNVYCFELGAAQDCMISNNLAVNCATFAVDTAGIGYPASTNITISNNTIRGTGVVSPSAAYTIQAHGMAVSTGWKVLNNTFENMDNIRGVIRLSGPVGTGGHVIRGNTYVAETETSTFQFCSADGDGDIVSDNIWIRYSNFSDLTPSAYEYIPIYAFSIYTGTNVTISRNTAIWRGIKTTTLSGGTIALGSNQASVSLSGVVINGNVIRGDYDYIVGFSSTHPSCRYIGNDTSSATGLISIPSTVVARFISTVYSGTSVPLSGTWKRGDTMLNELPVKGGISSWICTTAGTPGTWQPVYSPNVDDVSGSERSINLYSSGSKRAMLRLNTTAEGGADAGSGFEGYVYADNGSTARRWLYVNRTSTGEVLFNTNSLRLYPRTAATLDFWIDAWDSSQASRLSFREGNVLRWLFQKAGTTADLTLNSYSIAGATIDTPLTVVNASGGLVTLARPLKFLHPTTAATPGVNEVTIGGGDIRISRTADATGRQVVAGDDTRLNTTPADIFRTEVSAISAGLQTQINALTGSNSSNPDVIGSGTVTITANESLIPDISGIRDLGSIDKPWRDIYLTQATIHLGSSTVSISSEKLTYNNAPIENTAYTTYTIQTGTFSDPGGKIGDVVYVV